jgi:Flp pilus assembly protein TadB
MRNPWVSKHSKEEIDAAISQFKQRVAEYEHLGDRRTRGKRGHSKVGLLFLIVLIILGVAVFLRHIALVIVGLFVSAVIWPFVSFICWIKRVVAYRRS